MHVASSSATAMLVCLYQSGTIVRELYEKHESYLVSDSFTSPQQQQCLPNFCVVFSKFLICMEAVICETTPFSRTPLMPYKRRYVLCERNGSLARNGRLRKRRWNSSEVCTAERGAVGFVRRNNELVGEQEMIRYNSHEWKAIFLTRKSRNM